MVGYWIGDSKNVVIQSWNTMYALGPIQTDQKAPTGLRLYAFSFTYTRLLPSAAVVDPLDMLSASRFSCAMSKLNFDKSVSTREHKAEMGSLDEPNRGDVACGAVDDGPDATAPNALFDVAPPRAAAARAPRRPPPSAATVSKPLILRC